MRGAGRGRGRDDVVVGGGGGGGESAFGGSAGAGAGAGTGSVTTGGTLALRRRSSRGGEGAEEFKDEARINRAPRQWLGRLVGRNAASKALGKLC